MWIELPSREKGCTIPDNIQCQVTSECITRECHTYIKEYMNIVKARTK